MKIEDNKLFVDISEEEGTTTGQEEWRYCGNVISQADTIEELCDIYVFESTSKETHYMYRCNYDMGVNLGCIVNNQKFKMHLLENGNVYGAIWTNKGLIYVAKLNENGELELI